MSSKIDGAISYTRFEFATIIRNPLLIVGLIWVILWSFLLLMGGDRDYCVWEVCYRLIGHPIFISVTYAPLCLLVCAISPRSDLLREVTFRLGKRKVRCAKVCLSIIEALFVIVSINITILIIALFQSNGFSDVWSASAKAIISKSSGVIVFPLSPISTEIVSRFTPFQCLSRSMLLGFFLLFIYTIWSNFIITNSSKNIGIYITAIFHILGYLSLTDPDRYGTIWPLGNYVLCYIRPWSVYAYSSIIQCVIMTLLYITIPFCISVFSSRLSIPYYPTLKGVVK